MCQWQFVFIFSKDKQIEALNEELKQETMMTDTMVANMVSVDRSVFKKIYVIDLCPQWETCLRMSSQKKVYNKSEFQK